MSPEQEATLDELADDIDAWGHDLRAVADELRACVRQRQWPEPSAWERLDYVLFVMGDELQARFARQRARRR